MSTSSGVSSDESLGAETNEFYEDFDYELLRPAPEEWELYDIPDKTHLRNRAFDLRSFKILLRHHSWGFKITIGARKTKERILQVLKTIIYNHDPKLRPSWHDFVSRECDAGPRLLRDTYSCVRISRLHPRGVSGEPLEREKGDIPEALRESIFPPPRDCWSPNSSVPLNHLSTSATAMTTLTKSSIFGFNSYSPPQLEDNQQADSRHQSHRQPNLYPSVEMLDTGNYLSSAQSNLNSSTSQILTTNLGSLVTEALIRYEYSRFQKDTCPKEQSQPLIPYFRAADNLLTIRGLSTLSHVQLQLYNDMANFIFSDIGQLYPFRGRGPMSINDISDAIDCVIVIGRLLGLGSTKYDLKNELWANSLSKPQRGFLEAIAECDGNIHSDEMMIQAKSKFHVLLHDDTRTQGINFATNPTAIWTHCASVFDQFRIRLKDQRSSCVCEESEPKEFECFLSLIRPIFRDGDDLGVKVEDLVTRFFQNVTFYPCSRCGRPNSVKVERKFACVPFQLAIQPHTASIVQNRTPDILNVPYTNEAGEKSIVFYRLLGGIFRTLLATTPHFRVCWTDRDGVGPQDSRKRFYDASQACGVIAGGMELASPNELAPSSWWPEGRPPLLFYERILNPSPSTLNSTILITDNLAKLNQFSFPAVQVLDSQHCTDNNGIGRPPTGNSPFIKPPVAPLNIGSSDTNIESLSRWKGKQPQFKSQFEKSLQDTGENSDMPTALTPPPARALAIEIGTLLGGQHSEAYQPSPDTMKRVQETASQLILPDLNLEELDTFAPNELENQDLMLPLPSSPQTIDPSVLSTQPGQVLSALGEKILGTNSPSCSNQGIRAMSNLEWLEAFNTPSLANTVVESIPIPFTIEYADTGHKIYKPNSSLNGGTLEGLKRTRSDCDGALDTQDRFDGPPSKRRKP
ncbi:hypothetical protein FQN57_001648 [Myotisia sp. PD_48]|nr:hypothetical protein FQN57_001648 [Myotisia sp. PD_48]